MGFKDTGAMWRSNYDMEPEAFAAEMERLWLQVKPLYDSLHTYTRKQLLKKYGNKIVPETGPIPAHLIRQYVVAAMEQYLRFVEATGRRRTRL